MKIAALFMNFLYIFLLGLSEQGKGATCDIRKAQTIWNEVCCCYEKLYDKNNEKTNYFLVKTIHDILSDFITEEYFNFCSYNLGRKIVLNDKLHEYLKNHLENYDELLNETEEKNVNMLCFDKLDEFSGKRIKDINEMLRYVSYNFGIFRVDRDKRLDYQSLLF